MTEIYESEKLIKIEVKAEPMDEDIDDDPKTPIVQTTIRAATAIELDQNPLIHSPPQKPKRGRPSKKDLEARQLLAERRKSKDTTPKIKIKKEKPEPVIKIRMGPSPKTSTSTATKK